MKLGHFKAGDETNLCKIEDEKVFDRTEAGFGTSMRAPLDQLEVVRIEIAEHGHIENAVRNE